MPFRPTEDGSMIPVRAVNRPPQEGTAPPASPRAVAAEAPGLSTAARAALAVGAHSGERAARFAVEAVRSRGLAGMGAWTADHVDSRGIWVDQYGNSFEEDRAATQAFEATQAAQPGGGFSPADVQPYTSFLAQTAGQGITAYRQFTGQGPATPKPAPPTGGPSTGVILSVLGGIAVIGTVIAVAVSASRRPAVKTNRHRVRRHRARRHPRYFVMSRAA